MSRCVICYQQNIEEVSFENLFVPKIYCDECFNKLIESSNGCQYCSHPIGYNCCDKTILNRSLFLENQFLKDLFFQAKSYNLNLKLEIFRNSLEALITIDYSNYCIIPVPLSQKMYLKRGFNQSYILASYTKLKIVNCLVRLDDKTQSTKTYHERVNNPPTFKLTFLPKNKNVLIIDDIYTTGSTLKSIAKLFPKNYNVKFITIQRTLIK